MKRNTFETAFENNHAFSLLTFTVTPIIDQRKAISLTKTTINKRNRIREH